MQPVPRSRRDLMKLLGLGAASLTLPSIGAAQVNPTPARGDRKRLARIAHITDVHVQPERGAGEGLAMALRHLHAQTDKPTLILNTGDSVMDCFRRQEKRMRLQWDLWNSVLTAENKLPIHHAIGNHDIWGWDKDKSKTNGSEALWGKKCALAGYDMKTPYYSFDEYGWHFVALDTVSALAPTESNDQPYVGRLDDEQFAWLEKDLAAVDPKTPVLVFCHIPIVCVAPMLTPELKRENQSFQMAGGMMLLDNFRVKNLFKKYPNVKLCVSGHIHLIDRIEVSGVTYICDGAISGGWWKEPKNGPGEGEAGYSLIDLYDDGSFDHQYVVYGWEYRPEEPKPAKKAPAAVPAV